MESAQRSIVVVDDDQGILDSFDVMLGDDYDLVTVNAGDQALDLLDRHCPELMFLDLQMPEPDGLQVLAAIRSKGMPIKVVVVTALVQAHYQEMAEAYGVYRYLSKPLDVDEILEIAHTAIH